MRFRRQEFPQEREDENLQMMVKGSLRTTAVRHTQPAASPEWSRSKDRDPEIQLQAPEPDRKPDVFK